MCVQGHKTPDEWDEKEFNSVLERTAEDGVVSASRRLISADRLRQLLNAAPRDPDSQRPVLGEVDFSGATFIGDASFTVGDGISQYAQYAIFAKRALFEGATFTARASFYAATFKGTTSFDRATFRGIASFTETDFAEPVLFKGAVFEKGVYLSTKPGASFDGATFNGNVQVHSSGDGDVSFVAASFRGDVDAKSACGMSFARATFDTTRLLKIEVSGEPKRPPAVLGDVAGHKTPFPHCAIVLDRAVFLEPCRIEMNARVARCNPRCL